MRGNDDVRTDGHYNASVSDISIQKASDCKSYQNAEYQTNIVFENLFQMVSYRTLFKSGLASVALIVLISNSVCAD